MITCELTDNAVGHLCNYELEKPDYVYHTPYTRLNTDSCEAQCIIMLEEHEEREDSKGNIIKFHNNEFYAAIMDEDLERIEDILKKHGNNFLIEVQDSTPGKVFWKVNATTQTFLKSFEEQKYVKIYV